MKFGYDDDVPSLSVTTKSGELIGENISYSITGTAGDGSGLKKNSEGNPIIYRYAIDSTRNEKKYGSKEEPKEIHVSEDQFSCREKHPVYRVLPHSDAGWI